MKGRWCSMFIHPPVLIFNIKNTEGSKASPLTIAKVREFLHRAGIGIDPLKAVKDKDGKCQGVNGGKLPCQNAHLLAFNAVFEALTTLSAAPGNLYGGNLLKNGRFHQSVSFLKHHFHFG